MASLHELCDLPIEEDYFVSFDDLLEVIRDASIKHKFSFEISHKDLKRAQYKCSNRDCPSGSGSGDGRAYRRWWR